MISAERTLKVLTKNLVSFKGDKGEGVEYTEVIAEDAGNLVVLRAADASKLVDFEPGLEVTAEFQDGGAANLRVRKYALVG